MVSELMPANLNDGARKAVLDRALDLASDLGEGGEVDQAGDGGAAAEDELRPLPLRQVADLVEVDALVARRHLVGDELIQQAAGVDRRAVGEVAARVEIETHEGIARLE
jgi:hypothetical protein